jgi:hypothetical protein
MRESVQIAILSAVLFALAYSAFWYIGWFDDLGFHGTVSAVLGAILTSALTTVLMTVMFYSNRSRRDEEVHNLQTERDLD